MKDSENIKESDPYNFLLLSLYHYLKKNNFGLTAQKLFQEGKLDSIFKFPQDLKQSSNEKEKMQNDFIEFFYKNSFENENFDFLGDFWGEFWSIFANKMMNNTKVETLFDLEQKNILNKTYSQKNISKNFINENQNKNNNKDIIKSLNISSNISKITNNNIGETEEMLMNQKNYYWQENKEKINNHENIQENKINKINKSNSQLKNNQNYYDEEDEEGENDIEKEMDEVNNIHFNEQNSPNIIKQENEPVVHNVGFGNDYDNEMNKNIYSGFPNSSLSNFDFNTLGGYPNSNIKFERNMSNIPLRKGVEMGNNNNNDYDI